MAQSREAAGDTSADVHIRRRAERCDSHWWQEASFVMGQTPRLDRESADCIAAAAQRDLQSLTVTTWHVNSECICDPAGGRSVSNP